MGNSLPNISQNQTAQYEQHHIVEEETEQGVQHSNEHVATQQPEIPAQQPESGPVTRVQLSLPKRQQTVQYKCPDREWKEVKILGPAVKKGWDPQRFGKHSRSL